MVFRCILIWDFKNFSWPRSQSFLAPPFWPFSRFCRCIISCALFLKISFRPQSEVGLFYQDSELGFDRICFQHYVRASTEALLKALFTLILLDLRSWCAINFVCIFFHACANVCARPWFLTKMLSFLSRSSRKRPKRQTFLAPHFSLLFSRCFLFHWVFPKV